MPIRTFFCCLLLAFLWSCTNKDEGQLPCNGHTELCMRAYNAVAYPSTHNSNSYSPVFHDLVANQETNITQQLNDGIRCLNIDIALLVNDPYCSDSGIYVIHAYPSLGCEPLSKVLGEIQLFMEQHPREVLTITFEDVDDVNATQLRTAFEQANLLEYTYRSSTIDWLSLGEMINTRQRLVVFANIDDIESFEGFHDNWEHIFDTPYSADSRDDFSCVLNRGESTHPLFLVNHFITVLSPRKDSAYLANANPFLLDRLRQCQSEQNHIPNFVYVDFYTIGDIFAAIDSLNGVR